LIVKEAEDVNTLAKLKNNSKKGKAGKDFFSVFRFSLPN
jgi:hypothetical protein